MALFTDATCNRGRLLAPHLLVQLLDRRERAAPAIRLSAKDSADGWLSDPKQSGQGALP